MPELLSKVVPGSEVSLIERIRNGEGELFHDLVHPHERSVYLAVLSVLENEADAEEVAQEALLKAWTHLDQFRGESKFSTWLIRIAINEAKMRRRKDHRQHLFEPIEREDEDGNSAPRDFADWREIPSETLERKEVRTALMRALRCLREPYREVFLLRGCTALKRGRDSAAPRDQYFGCEITTTSGTATDEGPIGATVPTSMDRSPALVARKEAIASSRAVENAASMRHTYSF